MTKFHHVTALILGALLIAGCSTPGELLQAEQVTLPKEGKRLISTTASTRHTIISSKNSTSYICTEPPPDASLSADLDIDFGLTIVNLNGSEQADDNQDVEQEGLGGRSANVLIVRDLLYRTCELFINSKFSDDQKIGLFRDVLKTIEHVGAAKIATGTVPGARKGLTPTTFAGAGSGGGQTQTAAPTECGTEPDGTKCSNYCAKNKDASICNAICTSSGNDSSYASWCSE